jgi:hypothetical protein
MTKQSDSEKVVARTSIDELVEYIIQALDLCPLDWEETSYRCFKFRNIKLFKEDEGWQIIVKIADHNDQESMMSDAIKRMRTFVQTVSENRRKFLNLRKEKEQHDLAEKASHSFLLDISTSSK